MPYHDRTEPDFEHIQDNIPTGEKDYFGKTPRPALLRQMGQQLRELFFKPARHIQWCFHTTARLVQTWGANVRLVRSQFRESIIKLLSVMVLNMDLATCLVARRDTETGTLHHYTLSWLADQADLTPSQAKRASAWLKGQGIITNEDPVCERQPDGTYKGKASPKRISERLFEYFGMGAALKDQRDWASDRLKGNSTPQDQQVAAMRQQQQTLQKLKAMVKKTRPADDATPEASPAPATGASRHVRSILDSIWG